MLHSLPLDVTLPQATWMLFVALLGAVLVLEKVIFAQAAARSRQPEGTPVAATLKVLALCMLAAGGFATFLMQCGGGAGREQAAAFCTVYVVEFALSIDNLFVFLLIFNTFKVAPKEARRVLTWGIVGAVVLRGLFILVGASLFARFDWLFYFVGAFLIISGARLLWPKADEHQDAANHWAIVWGRKLLPIAGPSAVAAGPQGAFVVRENNRLRFTPLLLVLLAIEASDVVFALDSVPASFAITTQTQLVFFANMFAVMGLRCLYALLAHAASALRYLHVALAFILMLIGFKMVSKHYVHIADGWFLATVLGLLVVSAAASVLLPQGKPPQH